MIPRPYWALARGTHVMKKFVNSGFALLVFGLVFALNVNDGPPSKTGLKQAYSASQCEHRPMGRLIVVVICPPGLGEEEWRMAGQLACSSRRPCNAWIWDDPAKSPTRSPPMTDAQVNSAVAVWINNTGTLNVCSRGC